MATVTVGLAPVNFFIASFQFAGLRTLSELVPDWTTDSGRVAVGLEGQCDPSLVDAGFRDGNNQGSGSFFSTLGMTPWRFAAGEGKQWGGAASTLWGWVAG